ncbi:MAG TPA: DUF2442 domain-containing protein [Planctomycetota bacterium]|nr:DUF2442 domain-containing protein [Planctomycetota bacterium]
MKDDVKFLPEVVKAKYVADYCIHVRFNDGAEKVVDFSHWLKGPIFEPLKDAAYFRRFFLDGGTVSWPNGADIAPEALYEAAPVTITKRKERKHALQAH